MLRTVMQLRLRPSRRAAPRYRRSAVTLGHHRRAVTRLVALVAGMAFLWNPRIVAAAGGDGSEEAQDEPAPLPVWEALLEVGLAMPRGDLTERWARTDRGSNSRAGYEIGFRFRIFITPRLALSPGIHVNEFKSYKAVERDGPSLEVQTNILRVGIDAQYSLRDRRRGFAPYVGFGVGVARNRYQEDRGEDLPPTETANAVVVSLGAGLRFGALEISGAYHVDRFRTVRFVDTERFQGYNWDHIVVSLGWRLPGG